MPTINLTLPSDGDTIDAADVNTPLNAIAAVINGGIDSTNITDGSIATGDIANAAVTANKLGTGAANATVATAETTTSTSYANLTTTTDTVTVTIGANGLALVTISSRMQNNTSAAIVYVGVDISGANTVAATDTTAMLIQVSNANFVYRWSSCFLLTGLTAGSTTFKLKYKVADGGGGAGTATFTDRRIAVVPL